MFRNIAGQKLRVFAFNVSTNLPVTGDANNITCKVSINNSTPEAIVDEHPIEVEDGYYLFDLTTLETDGDFLDFYPESSTPDVVVFPTNHDRQTVTKVTEQAVTPPTEYGPKRVRTPNLEVEQFDPMLLQRLEERKTAPYPTLDTCGMSIASPNHSKYKTGCERCG